MEICLNLILPNSIPMVRRIEVGSSSDGFWSLTPASVRRLVLSSSIWSACAILIIAISSVAGSWFSLTLTLGYSLFVLTFAVLATGVFFLIQLAKLFLSLYRPSKATETRKG